MNKVILIGRLGKDAEIRQFEGGSVKVSFTMATSEKRKDASGNTVEDTEWHDLEWWGERAQKLAQWLTRGRQVMAEGRIKYEDWEKDGIKRRSTRISVQNVEFLANPQQNGQQQQQPQQYTAPVQQQQQYAAPVPYAPQQVQYAQPPQPQPQHQQYAAPQPQQPAQPQPAQYAQPMPQQPQPQYQQYAPVPQQQTRQEQYDDLPF